MFAIFLTLSATLSLVVAIADPTYKDHSAISDEYIRHLNDLNLSWKAGRNFRKDIPFEHIVGLLGSLDHLRKPLQGRIDLIQRHDNIDDTTVPENFDSRTQWPNCETMKIVRDQGSCGSCWAFGAVEAMSDRICVASNQKINVMISAQELLTCCWECGYGCNGGYTQPSWEYWVNNGLVSGGLYNDTKTCQPYTISPCEHHVDGPRPPCSDTVPTPKCSHKCQKDFQKSFDNDRYFGKKYNAYVTVSDIQKEIMNHGPVEASFTVYADFVNYKSGVYQRHSDRALGGHSIKIIGWGVENSLPYWLVANSWNSDWGDKGFFKILRGQNECGIEDNVYGGLPQLD